MKLSKIKITVIGLGYVGLPLALILSNKYMIEGYDINLEDVKTKIKKLGSPEFKKIFKKNNQNSFILKNKLQASKVNFVCASTDKKSLSVKNDSNLSFNIIKDLINKRKNFKNTYIVLMTTSEIGFSKKILSYLKKRNLENRFNFLYTPERIFPSNLYFELINNNRIIGNNKISSFKFIKQIFKSFVEGKIVNVDHTSAELIKVIENTYRNVNIGLANEFLRVSLIENLDIEKILYAANQHPRVSILNPGIGVGGHCIPVDPKFLTYKYKNIPIIKNSIESNEKQPIYLSKKISHYIKKNKFKKILFLGCTYKPNVADFRNSPAIDIIRNVRRFKHCEIFICDPYFNDNMIKKVTIVDYNIINKEKFDLVILLVAHRLFKLKDLKKCNFIDLSGQRKYENINNL